jgi:hypothetical protein
MALEIKAPSEHEPLICVGDGDNIGDVIDLHLLSGNLEEARECFKTFQRCWEP